MQTALHRMTVALAAFLIAAAAGCASSSSTPPPPRQPVADLESEVRFYEKVVAENPSNADAARRLADAKAQLARDLARDADAALRRGHVREAQRLASLAADYDPLYVELERDAARALVHVHLRHADLAIQRRDFSGARSQIEQAERALPDYHPTSAMRQRLDAAEARFFADLAGEYAADGDWRGALQAIERAAELRPDDPLIGEQRQRIVNSNRSEYFDEYIEEARALVVLGELEAANEIITPLAESAPGHPDIIDLLAQLTAQRARAEAAIVEARRAMDEARYEEAIAQLTLASELDVDSEYRTLLAQSRGGMAHREMLEAIENGDPRSTLLAARRVIEHVDDPQTERLIPQFEQAFVQDVLRKAIELRNQGRNEEARALVDDALGIVDSQELREFLASLDQ